MKMTPMGSEITEFTPERPDPQSIGLTIRSRTVFKPTINSEGADLDLSSSEAAMQESSTYTQEQRENSEADKKILTEDDVAQVLRMTVRDVRSLVKKKRLGFIKLPGRKRGFTQEIIDEFIRRESGLPTRSGPGIGNLIAPRPLQSISVEESRNRLRKVRRKT
jgi:excisionase family DNA binding protein